MSLFTLWWFFLVDRILSAIGINANLIELSLSFNTLLIFFYSSNCVFKSKMTYFFNIFIVILPSIAVSLFAIHPLCLALIPSAILLHCWDLTFYININHYLKVSGSLFLNGLLNVCLPLILDFLTLDSSIFFLSSTFPSASISKPRANNSFLMKFMLWRFSSKFASNRHIYLRVS